MVPVDPLLRIAPVQPVSTAAPGAITLDARVPLSALTVGAQVDARVLSDRSGGRFVALIDGRPIEIALPRGAVAGETLKMVVMADQPRLLLGPRTDAAAGAPGAGVSRAAAGAGSPADNTGSDREVSLSAAGRALNRLVADVSGLAARADAPSAGSTPAAAAALVAQPAAAPGALASQIAAALAGTLSRSGLFYESHQAQWVAGERSVETLKGEPQGRLAPLTGGARAPPAGGCPAASGSLIEASPAVAGDANRGTITTAGAGPAAVAGSALDATVDPATVLLVQQQLSALDSGSAGWSGQVLPGVHARLIVQEGADRPGQEDGDGDGSPADDWSTRLAVDLPRLGAVEARIALRGDRLVLMMAAGGPATAAELSAARDRLVQSLAAAGLTVDSLQVVLPAGA